MQIIADRIVNDLTPDRLEDYWKGFKETAFAIYDDGDVFLFNHPRCQKQTYIKIPKTEHFNACTLILFEEYPTAIVDVTLYSKFEEIYSLLIHELFHGYQYLYGESRFPDESKGSMYPLDHKNIQLRIQERTKLYEAVMANNIRQQDYISEFILLRERRTEQFPQFVEYENLMETIEGPAHYVEYKALQHFRQDDSRTLDEFSTMLLDREQSHIHIRRSCYSSGLFICLLLDKICCDWQTEFTKSSLDLYTFLKNKYPIRQTVMLDSPENTQEIFAIMEKVRSQKKEVFEQFNETQGIKFTINSPMKITGYDPMNITFLNGQAIHHRFIKIKIREYDYLIQQPVLTTFQDHFMQLDTVQFFLKAVPEQMKNGISIEGIGYMEGTIKQVHPYIIQFSI